MIKEDSLKQTWCQLAFVLYGIVICVLLAVVFTVSMSGGALGLTKAKTTLLLWSLVGVTLAGNISQLVMCPAKNRLIGAFAFALSLCCAIAQVTT